MPGMPSGRAPICSTRWNLSGSAEIQLEVAAHLVLAEDAAIRALGRERLHGRDLRVAAERLGHLGEDLPRLVGLAAATRAAPNTGASSGSSAREVESHLRMKSLRVKGKGACAR